jgi:hypothetical protein
VLGSIFLVACVLATLSIAGILFVLFGPVPVNRKVTIVPRLAVSPPVTTTPMPSLVAQLAPAREQQFAPTAFPSTLHGAPPIVPARPTPTARTPEPPPLPLVTTPPPVPQQRKPKGHKVQPLPRKRAAKGTEAPSPFAPVVRRGHRPFRDEDVATNPVGTFESEEFTLVDDN